MFSGIITAIGTISHIERFSNDRRLGIDYQNLNIENLAIGDSIAINGVCLSILRWEPPYIFVDVSKETLVCTTLSKLQHHDLVNLELALGLSERLNGHIVSGHIDGMGEVISFEPIGRSTCLRIKTPKMLGKYIVKKGSICVDGVSLTINEIIKNEFVVNIIPHTLESTILKHYNPGQYVNLEVDMIARYIEKLLTP